MDRSYEEFIKKKLEYVPPNGFDPSGLADHLYPYQRDIVSWACNKGRSAIFADCGLGKTAMQIEWARQVTMHTGGRVLIVAPLAVTSQSADEASRFGVDTQICRDGNTSKDIVITNYEMLSRFDCSEFAGVVLDESSILKAHTGKVRTFIIDSFKETPYRLACTATPAPNDFMELGNHSEFLGIQTRSEMLAEYFVHDGGETQKWRLKGHAKNPFWEWVCQWAVMVRSPSDLGYSDDGFVLPELNIIEHTVPVDHADAAHAGLLFMPEAKTLSEQRATRKATLEKRVRAVADIVAAEPDAPWLIWCELNAEGDALTKAIDGAIQIKGSDSHDDKASRMLGFASGDHKILVTKPSVAGFGMNWQHCAKMAFVGASNSYEKTYQAIRRCWRFGQKERVDVHMVRAETESAVAANFRRKERDAARMASAMTASARAIGSQGKSSSKEWTDYIPRVKMDVPNWLLSEV